MWIKRFPYTTAEALRYKTSSPSGIGVVNRHPVYISLAYLIDTTVTNVKKCHEILFKENSRNRCAHRIGMHPTPQVLQGFVCFPDCLVNFKRVPRSVKDLRQMLNCGPACNFTIAMSTHSIRQSHQGGHIIFF